MLDSIGASLARSATVARSLVALCPLLVAAHGCATPTPPPPNTAGPVLVTPRTAPRTMPLLQPAAQAAAEGPVLSIRAGGDGMCALLRDGRAACWDYRGSKAEGPAHQAWVPDDARDLLAYEPGRYAIGRDGRLRRIGTEKPQSQMLALEGLVAFVPDPCVLDREGRVFCDQSAAEPYRCPYSAPVARIAAGEHHTCAVLTSAAVECEGSNGYGQLGVLPKAGQEDPDMPAPGEPQAIRVPGIEDAIDVAAGAEHSCALHRSGAVSCWGSGYQGNLGVGHRKSRGVGPVPGVDDAVAITAAWEGWTTCVLRRTGVITCWGGGESFYEYQPLQDGTVDLPRFEDVTLVELVGGTLCFADRRGLVRCAEGGNPSEPGTGQSPAEYPVVLDVSTLP